MKVLVASLYTKASGALDSLKLVATSWWGILKTKPTGGIKRPAKQGWDA